MAPIASDRPSHLSFVALILILWHGALAADYLNLRFAFAPEMPSILSLFPLGPLWAEIAWGAAVLLGLAGSLFLIVRDDAAVLILFAAAVAVLVALAGLWGLVPLELLLAPPLLAVIPVLVLAPLVGWLYARMLKRQRALF